MSRVNNKYSKELKIQIVKLYLETDINYNEIINKYGIKSKTQLYSWVKKYKLYGEKAFKNNLSKPNFNLQFNSLDEEVNFLRIENSYLKKLCDILKRNLDNS